MKLSAYKELDSSKRAQTLSRIILIAGAHLVVIGGAYLVSTFGDKQGNDPDSPSMAGVGTWSNRSSDANAPSVDASSGTLFDSRAGDLSGYNAGDPDPVLLASASSPSSSKARYAPRRPSDSGSSSSNSSTRAPSTSTSSSQVDDDEFLSPINSSSDVLYPVRSSSASEGLSKTIDYKIQSGDSLWGISKRFNVTVAEITAVNPGIKANAIRVGQSLNIPRNSTTESMGLGASSSSDASKKPVNGSIYTVKAGDVLSRIASRQGMTVAELKRANGLSNDVIRVGQELVIPAKKASSADLVSKQHRGPKVTIEAGDTIGKIAAIYGVSPTELMKLNNISNPRLIRIGQTLLIPEKNPTPSTVTPRAQSTAPTRASNPEPTPRQPTRTLEDLPPPAEETLPTLPTLDDTFGEEDLEDQPLIQISE
ncbi:muramidase family protein [Pelagicoccus albus]|uniref:LysM peptidoglycan-binding domain-containing protein n=1 Tax=Pelagicoccus albus TaxID=415222 RepID=A0A7X1B9L2_9BACT|nr:LysM peptidoglycan-binding domain-containing protein [Pelagicoccus albus]MBC2608198.1 LysM peptidoglycan-binding domain-containing protein [Pelagicoccus albus]